MPSNTGQNKLHELFNSLTSAWELSRLAKREIAPNHAANLHLEKVALMTEHAIRLTNELSTQANHVENKVHLLDLNKILRQSLASLDSTLFHGIKLQLCLDALLPAVKGRPPDLQQLFTQILTNAAQAIQPQIGEISIETGVISFNPECPRFKQKQGDWFTLGPKAYITITNTGMGMDPDTLARAFDPFFTTKLLGEGLGLTTILEIVNQHKGGISVTSQLTQGTAVSLFLPVAQSFN